jgi:ELWxxDGT repeat protein
MPGGEDLSRPRNLTAVGDRVIFSALTAPSALWVTDGTSPGTRQIGSFSGCPATESFFSAGSFAIFEASDEDGYRTWASDGTEAGTLMLADVWDNEPAMVVDGRVFFAGEDLVNGEELWVTDGTPAGTYLVKNINNVTHDAQPSEPVDLDGIAYFSANDQFHGRELWRSDGTAAGTWLVKDINEEVVDDWPEELYGHTRSSAPQQLMVFEGALYFTAIGDAGRELYRSDGTADGTQLLRDIKPGSSWSGPYGSYPQDLTVVGDALLFVATGPEGRELWTTDGTPDGTVLVKDIDPAMSSSPEDVVSSGDRLFFTAYTSEANRELWCSDGTTEGTYLVRDIHPGDHDSNIQQMVAFSGGVLFVADDGVHGEELWYSDGSSDGTFLVRDIRDITRDADPSLVVEAGGLFYFVAHDGVHGRELWRTDGTAAGTMMVKDIYEGSYGSSPRELTAVGGTLLFSANQYEGNYVWATDGTEAGTVPLPPGRAPYHLTAANDRLFFATEYPYALWTTDGTPEGTVKVKDVRVDFWTSTAAPLYAGGKLYFAADDPTHGDELWVSDGTEAGTVLLKDVYPGSGSSRPQRFVQVGDEVAFTADDGVHGSELWKTDGTPEGTVLVQNVNTSTADGYLGKAVAIDGIQYFGAQDIEHGWELWRSDGTADGTYLLKDLTPGPEPSYLNMLAAVNGRALFYNSRSRELWATDGTEEGTVLLGSMDLGRYRQYRAVGNKLFLRARTYDAGTELWVSDGTPGGTFRVKDINPGSRASSPDELTAVGDRLFFTAEHESYGRELWVSDGTEAGTQMVRDIWPGGSDWSIGSLFALGDKLLFKLYDYTHGSELWVSDGTEAGTGLVADIRPGSESSNIEMFCAAGGYLYFQADDGFHGEELWRSDGTAAGTNLVADLEQRTYGSSPSEGVKSGGVWYFTASDGSHGKELWKTDGTAGGTMLVKDIHLGPQGARIGGMTDIGGTLYFRADDGTHGDEPWVSDGTEAGTVLLKDLAEGNSSSSPRDFVVSGGRVFFTGHEQGAGWRLHVSDGTTDGTTAVPGVLVDLYSGSGVAYLHSYGGGVLFASASMEDTGKELWFSDGTGAGTYLVKDIQPGSASSGLYPHRFTDAFGYVFFAAEDGTHGREYWRTDGTPEGTLMLGDIFPGESDSDPRVLVDASAGLLFRADDGEHGNELWVTDGTPGGTALLKDIRIGPDDSYPDGGFLASDGTTYFSAYTEEHGRELWTTDGTTDGTALLADLNTYTDGSDPSDVVKVGDVWYFAADYGERGPVLWRTDGTDAGTYTVRDIAGGETPLYPTDLFAFGDRLVFSGRSDTGREPYISDGTAAGTHLLKDLVPGDRNSEPHFLAQVGDKLLFAARDEHGVEQLWLTDGNEAGTHVIEGQYPPGGFQWVAGAAIVVGDMAYFAADDLEHGSELWKTDGTLEGTTLVKDIAADPFESSYPSHFVSHGGLLYFSAASPAEGRRCIWVSDGTEAGTQPLPDTDAYQVWGMALAGDTLVMRVRRDDGSGVLAAYNITQGRRTELLEARTDLLLSAGDRVSFITRHNDPAGDYWQLWTSDGTPRGTRLATDRHFIRWSDRPDEEHFAAVGDTVFFAGGTDAHDYELWASDGTEAGTYIVRDIQPGPDTTWPTNLTNAGGKLFFAAEDGLHGMELWTSDGTEAGTHMVHDANQASEHANPDHFTEWNGRVYFFAYVGGEYPYGAQEAVLSTDGTAGGTSVLAEGRWVHGPRWLGEIDGRLVWGSGGPIGSTDGTPEGTGPVEGIPDDSGKRLVAVTGERILFGAYAPDTGRELWQWEGTTPGPLVDINQVTADAQLGQPVELDGGIYFVANAGGETHLYRTDGTPVGTEQVLGPDQGFTSLGYVGSYAGLMYLHGTTDDAGRQLWATDGTVAGTRALVDVGHEYHTIRTSAGAGGEFYFVLPSREARELWRTDGTVGGTVQVGTFRGDGWDESVYDLRDVDGVLYFIGDDGLAGRELWRSDGTPEGTYLVKDINTDSYGTAMPGYLVAGDLLYFQAGPTHHSYPISQPGLWRSDLTEDGTFLLKAAQEESMGRSFAYGDRVVFSQPAGHGRYGFMYDLWITDGTIEGTQTLLQGLDAMPGAAQVAGGRLYMAFGSSYLSGLLCTDGTSKGTFWLSDTPIEEMAAMDGMLYFSTDLPEPEGSRYTGAALWRTDGKPQHTEKIREFWSDNSYSDVKNLQNVAGTLFLSVREGRTGEELWTSDGTADGTRLVRDVNRTTYGSRINRIVVAGDLAYFTAQGYRNLWRTDGTEEGTFQLHAAGGDRAFERVGYPTPVGGTLYFWGEGDPYGRELWKTDGTDEGTVRLTDIGPGRNGASLRHLHEFNGSLLFANLEQYGYTYTAELFTSDGTPEGTVRLASLEIDCNSDNYDGYAVVGNVAFLVFWNSPQVLYTDGTPRGSGVLGRFGRNDSLAPRGLTAVGDKLFFIGHDARHGEEMWVVGKPNAHAGGPYTVEEVGHVAIDGSVSTPFDPDETLRYEWDLDGDAIFGETGDDATRGDEIGEHPTLFAADLDGPGQNMVRLRVVNSVELSDEAWALVNVINVAPTAELSNDGPVGEGSAAEVRFANVEDSLADLATLRYVYDLDGDGIYELVRAPKRTSC